MSESPTLQTVDLTHRGRSSGFSLTALGALYTLTLRQHLHGKRWMVMGALFLTPVLLAGVVRALAPNVQSIMLEFSFIFMFIPQALLPLLALLYGSGIVQDEQEEQTFTYLLIRPMPRWAIYVVKVLATLTTTTTLTTVFTTLTYLVIYVGADTGGQNIPWRCFIAVCIHVLTVAAYCCLFGLMSLLTRWTMVLGILYTGLFEVILANMPFSIRRGTILYYARLITIHSLDFPYTDPRGGKVNLAAGAWSLDAKTDPTLGELPTLGTCLLVLLIASLLWTALGAYLCSRREFHVKTPEGG